MKKKQEIICVHKNITLTKGDLERCEPGEYLNDNIIDFYLDWISEFRKAKEKKIHIFNTHFYQLIKRDIHRTVEKVAADVKLFDMDYLIVPINERYE